MRVRAQTEHVIPDRHVSHAFADLVDNPSGVITRITGVLQRLALREPAGEKLPVSKIDAGGSYHDANLSWSGMRLGHLTDAQGLGTAVLGELKRKHPSSPLWSLLAYHAGKRSLHSYFLSVFPVSVVESAATKASGGTSTRPTIFIRFLPSFCLSSSLRFRVMSPP